MTVTTVATDVSVLGLGTMGAAIARTLAGSDRTVTVWNRTPARAAELAGVPGARVVDDAAAAVAASPITVICVTDCIAVREILEREGVDAALKDATVVQLSSGAPAEARELERRTLAAGGSFVQGVIFGFPAQLATPGVTLSVAGPTRAFERCKDVLESLSGNVSFLGEAVGIPLALESAQACFMFGAVFGFVHGALICESEGVALDHYGSTLAGFAPLIGGACLRSAGLIKAGSYDQPLVPVGTLAETAERLLQHSRDAGISDVFPAFANDLLRRALADGHADHDIASVIEPLRAGR